MTYGLTTKYTVFYHNGGCWSIFFLKRWFRYGCFSSLHDVWVFAGSHCFQCSLSVGRGLRLSMLSAWGLGVGRSYDSLRSVLLLTSPLPPAPLGRFIGKSSKKRPDGRGRRNNLGVVCVGLRPHNVCGLGFSFGRCRVLSAATPSLQKTTRPHPFASVYRRPQPPPNYFVGH